MPLADMPQSNKQHAVPQNIMDVEFKLIGDLTMRQFIYLIIFGILAYISFSIDLGLFKVPSMVFFAVLGLGLAFVPIEERGMDEWVVNFFKSVYTPTQRIWKKSPSVPQVFLYDNLAVVRTELITLAPTSSRRKLEEYLNYQDKKVVVDPLDIPEQEYILKVHNAFAGYAKTDRTIEVMEAPSVSVGVIDDDVIFVEEEGTPEQIPEQMSKEMPEHTSEHEDSKEKALGEPQKQDKEVKDLEKKGTTFVDKKVVTEPKEAPVQQQKISSDQSITQKIKNVIPKVTPKFAPKFTVMQKQRVSVAAEPDLNPITPDMHAGRRFTNLLPSNGELVLPIRGERVLKTSEETDIEQDIQQKAKKLEMLITDIKVREGIRTASAKPRIEPAAAQTPVPAAPITPSASITPSVPAVAASHQNMVQQTSAPVINNVKTTAEEEAKGIISDLKKQNEYLLNQIEQLRNEIRNNNSAEASAKQELLETLKSKQEKVASSYQTLNQTVQELEIKKSSIASIPEGPSRSYPIYSAAGSLTSAPNILSGSVKDSLGKPLINILLLLKNKDGEPVRAFKTNNLGQFILSTPLDNGVYTIEISPVNGLNATFDIISVEAKGSTIPPVNIVGK